MFSLISFAILQKCQKNIYIWEEILLMKKTNVFFINNISSHIVYMFF